METPENVWENEFKGGLDPVYDRPVIEMEPEEEVQEQPIEEDPFSSDLQVLLENGYLSNAVAIHGNDYVLKTLNVGEDLTVGLVSHKYGETIEAGKAYATASVAASLASVNGKPLVLPISSDESEEALVERKFYHVKKYPWPTVKTLYGEYAALLERRDAALEELEKK